MAENPTTAPPAAQPTAALHTANSPTEAHCPYRQASLLQQALEPDKMRVGLFLGAAPLRSAYLTTPGRSL